jgi:hypothetical protein
MRVLSLWVFGIVFLRKLENFADKNDLEIFLENKMKNVKRNSFEHAFEVECRKMKFWEGLKRMKKNINLRKMLGVFQFVEKEKIKN